MSKEIVIDSSFATISSLKFAIKEKNPTNIEQIAKEKFSKRSL